MKLTINTKNEEIGVPPISNILQDELLLASCEYTPEQLIQAAAYYAVLGSSLKVEKMLGIPAPTIRTWYKKPWWKELLKEVRAAKQDELDALLTGIIMEASNQLADRVKYGNSVVTDAGEVVKVPLKATELATAGIGIPYDKRALIRGDATVKVELQGSVDAILERLKNTFESLAKTILIDDKEVITNE